MSKYFGTDGFRGEVNKTLTTEHAWKIGRFLGHYFSKEHRARVVIGKDTRRSSYSLEYALVAGLTASGADAYILHVTTTPSVSYITRTDGFDCGIMISASHNPYHDNGIKLFGSNGEKMDDYVIALIEEYLDGEGDVGFVGGDKIGVAIDYVSGRNRYIGHLISLATVSYRGMKVGLDCANGSAWMIAKSVFDALGAKTYVINNEPDGSNINVGGSTHIEMLQCLVKANNLDVGFAFDGDADRCIAVDERGEVVDGNGILYVAGKYLKHKRALDNDVVVATKMSNLGLWKALDECGIRVSLTEVGDKNVHDRMIEYGYSLGGEESGHIIFDKLSTTGDGIITAISLMEIICTAEKPLSELVSGYHPYPQRVVNLKVSDKDAVCRDDVVLAAVEEAHEKLTATGRVVFRKSGTEPMVRIMVEAVDSDECDRYADYIVKVIRKRGYLGGVGNE